MAVQLSVVKAKVWSQDLCCGKSESQRNSGNLLLPRLTPLRCYWQLYDAVIWLQHWHELPISVGSGYVQVDRTSVLVVGTEVLKLDLFTLQTTLLAHLLWPRREVGVALVENTVFAFGGVRNSEIDTGMDRSTFMCEGGTLLRVPSKTSSTSCLLIPKQCRVSVPTRTLY